MDNLTRLADLRRNHRGFWQLLLTTLLLLVSRTSTAALVSDVVVTRQGESYVVQVRMEVVGQPPLAWQVLTDYDNLQKFVPGMLSSRVVSRKGDEVLLEQTGEVGLAFVKITSKTVSQLLENPKHEIRFDLVSGNLKRLRGSWTLVPNDHATIISYRAELIPDFPLPPLIGSATLGQNVKTMVDGLAKEIERRNRVAVKE